MKKVASIILIIMIVFLSINISVADVNDVLDYFDAGTEYKAANRAFDAKNYELAIIKFSNVIEKYSSVLTVQKLCNIHTTRGNVYYRKGDFDKAIDDYSIAIRYDPKYYIAYQSRGAAFAKKGELKKSINDFSKAIELEPNSAMLYYNRCIAYKKAGDIEKAKADYDEACELKNKGIK